MSHKTELLQKEGQIEIASVSESTIVCSKCGAHNESATKYCNECGKLSSPFDNDNANGSYILPSAPPQNDNNDDEKSNAIIIIVAAPAAQNNNLEQPLINNNANGFAEHIDEGTVIIPFNQAQPQNAVQILNNMEGAEVSLCGRQYCSLPSVYQCSICQAKFCTNHTRIISNRQNIVLYGCVYCVNQQLNGRRGVGVGGVGVIGAPLERGVNNRNVARCCIRRLIIRLLVFFILIIIAGIYAGGSNQSV